ncbi:MAG TPA: nitroreductase/quinone reductase family protein [Ktedonobacterales bacterium]
MRTIGIRLPIVLYRLTRGWQVRGWLLVLTTRGRKSGQRRVVALRYVRDGSTFVIVGSNWGKPNAPAWYLNLQADPHVEVQVGGKRFQAEARTVRLEERQRLWDTLVQSYKPYERYAEMTKRVLPIVRLTPQ